MNRLVLSCSILALSNLSLHAALTNSKILPVVQAVATQVAQQAAPVHNSPEEQKMGARITYRLANIIANVVTLLQKNNNARDVGHNVTNIFTDVVNIALEAFRSGELSLDATPEEVTAYALRKSKAVRGTIICMTRGMKSRMGDTE